MTAQNGALVLLKVGDGGDPENFTTVGGLRTTGMLLHNQPFDATSLESGAWQQLLDGAGIHKLAITGGGMFTDAMSEETLRGYAFTGSINNYQMFFPNGDHLDGPFQILTYERAGNHNAEETFSLMLESAGTVIFTHI